MGITAYLSYSSICFFVLLRLLLPFEILDVVPFSGAYPIALVSLGWHSWAHLVSSERLDRRTSPTWLL